MARGCCGFSPNVFGAYVTSAAFFLVFVAFNTAQGLATTVMDADVANASLAVLYGLFTLLCIITPKLMAYTGPKYAMLLGAIPYCLLVFSYVIPLTGSARLPLSLPVFGLVGISASMLWTGQGIYLGRASVREASATGVSVESMTSQLNGVFWAVFQLTGLTGLAAASLVQLAFGKANFAKANQSLFLVLGIAASLGIIVFLLLPQQGPMTAAERAAELEERQKLAGMAGGLGDHDMAAASTAGGDSDGLRERGSLKASVNAVGGHPTTATAAAGFGDEDEDDATTTAAAAASSAAVTPADGSEEVSASLNATLELLYRSRQMKLMLPIIIYNGLSLGWFFAAFPLFYSPSDSGGRRLLPRDMVGFVQGSFYVANTLFSLAFGFVAARCGRRPVFYVACTAAVVFLVAMLVLQSGDVLPACSGDGEDCSSVSYAVTFMLSVLFAVSDSVFESQLPAILQSSTFFESEADRDAAQGNLRMWQSLGFAVQLALNIFVKSDVTRVIVLLSWFVFAAGCALATDACVKRFDVTTAKTLATTAGRDDGSEHLLSNSA